VRAVGEVVWARWRAAARAPRGGLGVHALVLLAAAWPFMPWCQSRLSGRSRAPA